MSADSRFINSNPLREDLEHILKHTGNLWEELRGKQIFITGGTGFIGCWLLESLLAADERFNLNARIFVLTRNADGFRTKRPHLALHPAVVLVPGDVRNFANPAGDFEWVVHGAAESSSALAVSQPAEIFSTIVAGMGRVLKLAAETHAKKLLFLSSGAVYGQQPSGLKLIAEDHPSSIDLSDPLSAYAEGKRAAEMLCSVYSSEAGIDAKIARCFSFVGPYLALDSHFAIGNFIRDRLHSRTITVESDGTAIRSYLYTSDLCIWLWKILADGKPLRAYNVGSEQEISVAELARFIAADSSPELNIELKRKSVSGPSPKRYVPSTVRARTELQLEQRVGLQAALRSTIRWNEMSAAEMKNAVQGVDVS